MSILKHYFTPNSFLIISVDVWDHTGYARITVIHRNFLEATPYNFWKITADQRDSDTFKFFFVAGLTYPP
jgi:hypothetical protein